MDNHCGNHWDAGGDGDGGAVGVGGGVLIMDQCELTLDEAIHLLRHNQRLVEIHKWIFRWALRASTMEEVREVLEHGRGRIRQETNFHYQEWKEKFEGREVIPSWGPEWWRN